MRSECRPVRDVLVIIIFFYKTIHTVSVSPYTDVSGQMSSHFGGQTRTFDEYLVPFVLEIGRSKVSS